MPLVAHGGQFYTGSYVKANPVETATDTLNKLQIDNDVYEIQGGGGGGTTVVANPSGQATADLEKLQVGETIYEVVGQGGQGMTKTLLWGNMPFSYPSTQVSDATLSANIKDFDEIIIYGGWYSDNVHDFREERFDAKVLDSLPTATTDLSKQFVMVMNPYVQNGAQYSQWIRISKGSADNIIHFRYNNAVGVYAIVGVKYDTGSSSEGTGGKLSKTSLYSGENTSVNVELPLLDDITKYDELEFVVGFNTTDKSRACFRCSVADFIRKFPYTGSVTNTNPQFITTIYDTYYMCFQCGSADNKIYVVRSSSTKLYEINGIKYNTGKTSALTTLWNYVDDNNGDVLYGTFTKTLHDSINNYDDVIIELVSYKNDSGNWDATQFFRYNVENLTNAKNPGRFSLNTHESRSSSFYLSGTTFQKIIDNLNNTNGLVNVYGVKYGGERSGGGSVSEWTKVWNKDSGITFVMPSGKTEIMLRLIETSYGHRSCLATTVNPLSYPLTEWLEVYWFIGDDGKLCNGGINQNGVTHFSNNTNYTFDFEIWVR